MSEEDKDFGDKAKDAFDDAKESAKKAAEEAKEAAGEFKEGAKKTADEFREGLKTAGGDNKKSLQVFWVFCLDPLASTNLFWAITRKGSYYWL